MPGYTPTLYLYLLDTDAAGRAPRRVHPLTPRAFDRDRQPSAWSRLVRIVTSHNLRPALAR